MIPEEFRLSTYRFDLPEELIAQQPVTPRDSSRLMHVDRKTGSIRHYTFKDLPQLLSPRSLLVANSSKVFRARLKGHRVLEPGTPREKHGGAVEVLLLEQTAPLVWEAMFRAAAKGNSGVVFRFAGPSDSELRAEIIRSSRESDSGTILLKFNSNPLAVGEVPLPPYILASKAPRSSDETCYQTVYAKQIGSSAAPTAGLHFTPDLIEELKQRGMKWEEILLHVGLGTFRPVKSEDIREHVMHEEAYEIGDKVASSINRAKGEERPIVAVGTTSLRALESSVIDGKVHAGSGRTRAFFYPGSKNSIQATSGLITNFHLSESSLLMLVCHFAGTELVLRAYAEAVREKYRFFSYGDAMWIS